MVVDCLKSDYKAWVEKKLKSVVTGEKSVIPAESSSCDLDRCSSSQNNECLVLHQWLPDYFSKVDECCSAGRYVTCNKFNQITRLNLGDKSITSIPNDIFKFRELILLDLSFNQINGSIPSNIGKLKKLKNLSGNKLKDSIPASLGDLENLTGLWLALNKLTGSIPPELGNLSRLQTLFLSGNELSGELPERLFLLSELKHLYLNMNLLEGKLPKMSKLTNLQQLDLSYNQFSGKLPNFSQLQLRECNLYSLMNVCNSEGVEIHSACKSTNTYTKC
ncbi:hypothetical protein HDU92_006497 [Lobulomyces angularis]|nr:hypothetical protein HDU92_006497 [Lobulomyces angularis]